MKVAIIENIVMSAGYEVEFDKSIVVELKTFLSFKREYLGAKWFNEFFKEY